MGAEPWVAHALSLVVFLALVVCGNLLGGQLAGRAGGALAGVLIASSPPLLLFGAHNVTEPLVGLWILLAFLLSTRRAPPFWVGACCGLAYILTTPPRWPSRPSWGCRCSRGSRRRGLVEVWRRTADSSCALVARGADPPAVPEEPSDLRVVRRVFWYRWEGAFAEPEGPPLNSCIEPGSVVLAENAPFVAWETGAVAIRLPASRPDLDWLLEELPIRFIVVSSKRWAAHVGFHRTFEAAPECGRHVYVLLGSRDEGSSPGT